MSDGFEVPIERSIEVAREALPLMTEHGIPPIPQNYSVWYDYIGDENPELSRELRKHLEQGMAFTPQICRDLFQRFMQSQEHQQTRGLQGALEQVMAEVMAQVATYGDDVVSFSGILNQCDTTLTGLAEDAAVEQVRGVVQRLLEETNRVQQRNAQVEASLEHMHAELDELRDQVNRLSRDSRTDKLTGLANRRVLDETLPRLIADSHTKQRPLSLILIDIDHFKGVNDTHGHLTGDRVLRFVGSEIRRCIKGRDVLVRYGGEEFAVLLPDTALRGALHLAESIRTMVGTQRVPVEAGKLLDPITLTLGVAEATAGDTQETMFHRADKALYLGKEQGRNRVRSEQDLPPPVSH